MHFDICSDSLLLGSEILLSVNYFVYEIKQNVIIIFEWCCRPVSNEDAEKVMAEISSLLKLNPSALTDLRWIFFGWL